MNEDQAGLGEHPARRGDHHPVEPAEARETWKNDIPAEALSPEQRASPGLQGEGTCGKFKLSRQETACRSRVRAQRFAEELSGQERTQAYSPRLGSVTGCRFGAEATLPKGINLRLGPGVLQTAMARPHLRSHRRG